MEVVVTNFKALVQHLPGGNEKLQKHICQANRYPDQDSNRRRMENEVVHCLVDKTETDAGMNQS
jgi:hypothetical protein